MQFETNYHVSADRSSIQFAAVGHDGARLVNEISYEALVCLAAPTKLRKRDELVALFVRERQLIERLAQEAIAEECLSDSGGALITARWLALHTR